MPVNRQLRCLHLHQNPQAMDSGSDGYHPSLEEFTSAFKEMQRLESLYPGNYAPRLAPQPDTPTQTRISFPALSSSHLSQFFRLIEIPGSAHTSTQISDPSWSVAEREGSLPTRQQSAYEAQRYADGTAGLREPHLPLLRRRRHLK